jgi:hypothetical protein
VGKAAEVEDEAAGFGRFLLKEVDEGALMIRLEGGNLDSELDASLFDPPDDVDQGVATVDLRLAGAEGVEIGAVQEEDSRTWA